MAYRVEKEASGRMALVVDGFEKGIADSPYLGISSIKNMNISYLEGATYVNYKRQRINTAGGSTTFTGQTSPSRLNYTGLTLNVGDAVTLSTSGTLPAPLATSTTYFIQARTSTTFQLATELGGSTITITNAGSGTHTVELITMDKPIHWAIAPSSSETNARTYILDELGQVWQDSGTQSGTSFPYFVLLAGNNDNSTGGDGTGLAFWKNYLFVFREDGLEVCGNGNNVSGINSSNWIDINNSGFLMPDNETVAITPVTEGDTIVTMDDPWPYATGTFQVQLPSGQVVNGAFISESNTFTISPAANSTNSGDEATVTFLLSTSGAGDNMAFVSYLQEGVFFCNNSHVGLVLQLAGQNFDPEDFLTYSLNYSALDLPSFEKAIWLEQIGNDLQVAGRNFIYPWNTIDDSYDTPVPINEEMTKIFNILNTLYIMAGEKGNLYTSNGYNVSLVKKIPDSFTNSIDPSWVWGGYMFHRYKLFFGAVSVDQDNNKISGIFSLDVKNTNALNFESQNSTGLVPISSLSPVNILIDLNNDLGSVSGYRPDRYYSAYQDDDIGAVDYNDDTPWTNFEAVLETDLIPVGTILEKRTFEDVEYKLDKPLASGDQIRLSFRTTLSEAYTVIGTTDGTTNQVISETFASNVNSAQWLQFKVEIDCASSNSSYGRLREMRIH